MLDVHARISAQVTLALCMVAAVGCRPQASHAAGRPRVEAPLRARADASLPGSPHPSAPSRDPSTPLSDAELALLDRLVTDEVLFPDGAERQRYRRLPPETVDNQRHHAFELKLEPGMREGRHYHIIDIALARAGTYVAAGEQEQKPSGTGGPNGGFVEIAARTNDAAYDIRVSESMLLVEPVKEPRFSLRHAMNALLRRYASLRDAQPDGGP